MRKKILLLCPRRMANLTSLHRIVYRIVKNPINFSLQFSLCKIQILIFISSNIRIISWGPLCNTNFSFTGREALKISQSTVIITHSYFISMAKAVVHLYGNQGFQFILMLIIWKHLTYLSWLLFSTVTKNRIFNLNGCDE